MPVAPQARPLNRASVLMGKVFFAPFGSEIYLRNMNQPILAFGAPGIQEMVVIFLIVLLLFGAKKIPELARGIGKGMGEFKKAKTDFEDEIKRGESDTAADDWEKDNKTASAETKDDSKSDDHA